MRWQRVSHRRTRGYFWQDSDKGIMILVPAILLILNVVSCIPITALSMWTIYRFITIAPPTKTELLRSIYVIRSWRYQCGRQGRSGLEQGGKTSGIWMNWEEAAEASDRSCSSARYWRERFQFAEERLGLRLQGVLGIEGIDEDKRLGTSERGKEFPSLSVVTQPGDKLFELLATTAGVKDLFNIQLSFATNNDRRRNRRNMARNWVIVCWF